MSNNMFFLVAGYDELDSGSVLAHSHDLNEIIEFIKHRPITPYDFDYLAIYQCNANPVYVRFVDGKILLQ